MCLTELKAVDGVRSGMSVGKARRRWSAGEKYEMYVSVLTRQCTQREAAARYGVDRSTVLHIVKTAKHKGALDALASSVPGRAGLTPERAGLQAARAEVERLRATVAEQAVALHLHEGNARWN